MAGTLPIYVSGAILSRIQQVDEDGTQFYLLNLLLSGHGFIYEQGALIGAVLSAHEDLLTKLLPDMDLPDSPLDTCRSWSVKANRAVLNTGDGLAIAFVKSELETR